MENPLLQGSLALLSGNLVGGLSDRVVAIIGARVRMIESLKLGDTATSLLDSALGLFLQLGLITLGTTVSIGAFPWLMDSPGPFVLYVMGVSATSPRLFSELKAVNQIVFDEALYAAEKNRKERAAQDGEETQPAVSDS